MDKELTEENRLIVFYLEKAFSSDWFSSYDDKENLINFFSFESYKEGDFIYKEGEHSNKLYFLFEGRLAILRKTSAGDEFTLSELDGDNPLFFGDMSFITDKSSRSATVRSITNTKVLSLTRSAFEEMSKIYPSLAIELLLTISSTLVHRLDKTNLDLLYLYQALSSEIEGA